MIDLKPPTFIWNMNNHFDVNQNSKFFEFGKLINILSQDMEHLDENLIDSVCA